MKKILLTITFLIAVVLLNAQSPTFQWAKNIGGYYGYSTGNSVAVDASGNVYTTGYFEGRVDFDPGVGNYFLTSIGSFDIFVAKSDAAGNFLWVKQFGGISNDQGNSIAVSVSGNIYMAGRFSSTADFDPGTGVYNLISSGGTDIFVSMLNASGNLTWARQFGATDDDNARSMAIDASGNVYTTGNFRGNVDFDPGAGNFNLTNFGSSENTFISKLNSAGNFVLAKQLSGSGSRGNSISIDPSGNIYTTGYFSFTVDFDPGTGVFNLASQGGYIDAFISKLSPAGTFMWAKILGGASSDNATDIKTDAAGNVYTMGTFMGTADFDPGPAAYLLTSVGSQDIFISKLDASGNFSWAGSIGGANSGESASTISLDGAGNIYATGNFYYGTVDFDPGPGTFNLGNIDYSIFVLKLNSSGNFAWAKAFDATGNASGISITVDATANVYTTGYFREFCDFNPGAGSSNLIALVGSFMFTSKLDASGNFVWAKSVGTGASTYAKSMTTDLAGNVYTTGDFIGTVDFDPGPGVVKLSTAATDLKGDVFVTKCNSSGNLIWAKKLGGPAYDYVNAITVDASGNVYTAGCFAGTVDFNPGAGTFNITASSYSNIFVSKLNASGNFVWAKNLSNTPGANVYSIALDASGNLFTAGSYVQSMNSHQIYLNKFDPSGNLAWTKAYGGTLYDVANAIETDASGNIYVTGYFEGTSDLNPGAGIFNLTAAGSADIFVSKLDGSGNFIWAKQMGGVAYEVGSDIALDASENVFIAGQFAQTADFDPGPATFNLTSAGSTDIFISKLDNSGNFLWAKEFGGTDFDLFNSIDVDNTGNVYTVGTFYGTTDFDPGAGTFNLTAQGQDVFISKLNVSGNFTWAQQLSSTQNEQVLSVALDGSGNIYTCGNFVQTMDFDLGPGISNLVAHGNPDLFIHKMGSCVPLSTLIVAAGPTTFCSGGSVTLNANTGAGLTYQWQKNGVSIPGATTSSYVATTAGSYSVVESNAVPCTETSNNIIVSVPCLPPNPNGNRSIQNSEKNLEDINVYPNPTTGIFVIDSPPGQLQIFNAYGQQVNTSSLQKDEHTFDLSEFPDGIYILKLSTESSFSIKKIILNR